MSELSERYEVVVEIVERRRVAVVCHGLDPRDAQRELAERLERSGLTSIADAFELLGAIPTGEMKIGYAFPEEDPALEDEHLLCQVY
ncbi:hypothetical protein HN371_00345 [Candidatus Poribacteria bacterium]|jgi:hypothetical protein|nr:hypothetical protein [Candidatus Poribacteria bacterium]MBT5532332.1 hypothetical protein [Candidatus Poribacteria bacterium]MBT5714212.1 hypothetical protein [Candidatus Poribacteria bacterium]MBT7097520.1 hypothetical protein [Candidatus Poribacteria bacterium]MBT7807233.1 hypothetical protein [Candidatus Poribacteria bacterium]